MSDSDNNVTTTPRGADDQTSADPPASPEQAIADLERERDELHDRLLRTTADFENFRKRTERERRDLHEAVAADLVRDLLPVVDDLERALAAVAPPEVPGGAADTFSGFRQGVELIHRQLLEVLRRRGVEALDVVGQPFDPNWHEAIGHEPAEGRPDGEITSEVRRGYRLGQRLLRAAMVRVAKA